MASWQESYHKHSMIESVTQQEFLFLVPFQHTILMSSQTLKASGLQVLDYILTAYQTWSFDCCEFIKTFSM